MPHETKPISATIATEWPRDALRFRSLYGHAVLIFLTCWALFSIIHTQAFAVKAAGSITVAQIAILTLLLALKSSLGRHISIVGVIAVVAAGALVGVALLFAQLYTFPEEWLAKLTTDHSWRTVFFPSLLCTIFSYLFPLALNASTGRLPKLMTRFFLTCALLSKKDGSESNVDAQQTSHATTSVVSMPAQRKVTIQSLNLRTARLRAANAFVLSLILIVLAAAAVFVVYAGRIANNDVAQFDALDRTRKQFLDVADRLDRNQKETASLRSRLEELELNEKELLAQNPPASFKMLSEVRYERNSRRESLTAHLAAIDLNKQEYQRYRDLLAKVEEAILIKSATPPEQRSDNSLLIAAGLTRFGILVLAIYLVQILVALYRYNAQLGAQYSSHADALALLGESAEAIGEMSAKLRISVGFGRPEVSLPAKLVDQIAELLRARPQGEKAAK